MGKMRIMSKKYGKMLVALFAIAPVLSLGALFAFAKIAPVNAASSDSIVVKITTQGTGYIKNVWNSTVNYTGTGTCPASGTLNAFDRVDVSGCSVGDTMTVSEGTPGVSFRQWMYDSTEQRAFFGYSTSAAGTARGEITQMPSMSSFTTDATGKTTGSYFFSYFNYYGGLTSLPAGSFNTSKITTAGYGTFYNFNYHGLFTTLPDGSFDTSKISSTDGSFFTSFNSFGALISLPAGSFNINNISNVGTDFFYSFNNYGAIKSLPEGSFSFNKIVSAKSYFFQNFNYNGALTSLPAGSFKIENITSAGDYFFAYFNSYGGALTSLPAGSFNTSNITTVGSNFFTNFNVYGNLPKTSSGVSIKNVSASPITFYSASGSSMNTTSVDPGDSFEFYGVNQHTYSTNPDNGELTGGTPASTTDEGAQITLPTIATRAGYTFTGFTSNAWEGTKNLGETFILTGDTEITATWAKNADPAPAPTPNPDNGGQTPAAPNTGFRKK